ncbi:acyltransferase, partial [candidate division WOR-3 bacterium]|nr:acyltransferase [candidate division WOR-3 bacterium]
TGTSQIVGPRGEIYLRVGKSVEGVWTVECDLNQAEDKMVTERNDVIQDRREDLYTLKEK